MDQPKLSYKLVPDWPHMAEDRPMGHVPAVAVNSNDRIYAISRAEKAIIVFNLDGKLLGSWGRGFFTNPHGLHIDSDDNVYIADADDHTVRKFSPEGYLRLTLGTEGAEGEEGKPFHRPTDVAVAPSGEIYVSDGYAGFRVHKFSAEGELLLSWGAKGTGPGEFAVPHSVSVGSDGRVWVADRENHRIQIFSPDGEYITEWSGLDMPCTAYIGRDDLVYVPGLLRRFSIFDLERNLLLSWSEEEENLPAQFTGPHSVCTDSKGDLYIGNVFDGAHLYKFTRE